MQYKTIILELLEQRPAIYDQLRSQRNLLPALEQYALELKASHEAWKEHLSQSKAGSDPSQISAEALEMALQEMEKNLSCDLREEAAEQLLDEAMAAIRRTSPPA